MAKGWYIDERKNAKFDAKFIKKETFEYSIGASITCDINTT